MGDFDETLDAGPSKTGRDQLTMEGQLRHLNLSLDADKNKCKPKEKTVECSMEDKVAPEHFVFGIDLLLAKIMGCLPMKDLKSARLVCKRWNSFVLETFEKRGGLEITATFVDKRDYYDPDLEPGFEDLIPMVVEEYVITRFCDGVKIGDCISTFASFMSQSKKSGFKFPCANYQFLEGTLSDRSLQNFFKENGEGIKKLVLDVGAHRFVHNQPYVEFCPDLFYPNPTKLRLLLTKWAPNIQHLQLDNFPLDGDWNPTVNLWRWQYPNSNAKYRLPRLFPNGTILPNLRVLKVGESAPDWLVSELKEITPNLVEFSRLKLAE